MEIIYILNAIIAILIILIVSMQDKGYGLSSTFGGKERITMQKRGAEKILHKITLYLVIAFCIISFSSVFFSKSNYVNSNNSLNQTGNNLVNTGSIQIETSTGLNIDVQTSTGK